MASCDPGTFFRQDLVAFSASLAASSSLADFDLCLPSVCKQLLLRFETKCCNPPAASLGNSREDSSAMQFRFVALYSGGIMGGDLKSHTGNSS